MEGKEFWKRSPYLLIILFAGFLQFRLQASDLHTHLEYFHQHYDIIRNDQHQMLSIVHKRRPVLEKGAIGQWLISAWQETIPHRRSEITGQLLPFDHRIIDKDVNDIAGKSTWPLCHRDKKVFFYSRKLLREMTTGLIGKLLKLIPIGWVVAPISYVSNRLMDFVWEKHRYQQEGLAYLLSRIPPEQLALGERDVGRCLSSIQEAQHSLWDVHLLLRAWSKWDSYGYAERRKLRAKAEFEVRRQSNHYQFIGGPLTETIYPVTTKKGNQFLVNFGRSGFWLSKRPSISYWFGRPFALASMRWTFEVLKFASSFIPLPVLPGLVRGAFNRVYIQQIQHEGQLYVRWSMDQKTEETRQLLRQMANPFSPTID